MAFHNPDPKMRAIEQRNARERCNQFAKLFSGVWRRFGKAVLRLSKRRGR